MRPIRILLLDEVDRYPASAGTEGDPVSLAVKRTATFFNKKIIMTSSPTIKGYSRIEHAYEQSDKRIREIPCPQCGKFQLLLWENLKWDKDKKGNHKPETAYYLCVHNGCVIEESEKINMIEKGRWRKTGPPGRIAGFHINELHSPWKRWSDLVREFLKAKDKPLMLKTFINTSLAESFEDRGEAPDYVHIYARRENYFRNELIKEVLFLTAGVDVQKDRIEVELRGWGRHESWSIEHFIFMGDTAGQKVFSNLDNLLARNWKHPKGAQLQIKGLAIDTGGLTTQAVYYWCRRQESQRVFPIKGESLKIPIGIPKAVEINYEGKKFSKGLKLWGVGVSILKSELYAKLRLKYDEMPTIGYIHFPDYPEDYFKQLTAESLTPSTVGGIVRLNWEKIRERNEALDMAVYNRAAAIILGADRLTDDDWQQAENNVSLQSVVQTDKSRRVQKKTGRRILNKGIR